MKLFEDQFAMQAKMPFLAGITPWVLMDFRSPTRLLPGIQDAYNRKGIVSTTGTKKAAFITIRDHYADTLHIDLDRQRILVLGTHPDAAHVAASRTAKNLHAATPAR